jgi:hypothetical protein
MNGFFQDNESNALAHRSTSNESTLETSPVGHTRRADDANSLDLSWYTIDGGGDMWIGGDDLELSGTIGQHDASVFTMSGGGFELVGGFWNRAERVPNWRLVTPEAPEPLDEEYEEAVAEPLPPP